jgi:hypothetical protein
VIHPDTERTHISDAIGVGVVATAAIPRGTLVWVRDRLDLVLTPAERAALPAAYRPVVDRYGYADPDGRWIVCWDDGRLVNHGCEPAMRGVGPLVQIAVRDLAPGDEITCDYAECNTWPPMPCLCGAPTCRGQVSSRDLLDYADAWDREIRAAVAAAAGVPQPLWPFVLDPDALAPIVRGEHPPPSVREIYCPAA